MYSHSLTCMYYKGYFKETTLYNPLQTMNASNKINKLLTLAMSSTTHVLIKLFASILKNKGKIASEKRHRKNPKMTTE